MNKDPKEGAAKMPRPLCMSNLVCYALSCAELVSDILPFLLLYSAAFILLLLFFFILLLCFPTLPHRRVSVRRSQFPAGRCLT